jgi:WD40 repeat protein
MRSWDLEKETMKWSQRVRDKRPKCIAVSPNGKKIAAGVGEGLFSIGKCPVVLWDAISGRKICKFAGHKYSISSVCFSPDSSMLVSSELSPPNRGRVWSKRRENAIKCWTVW